MKSAAQIARIEFFFILTFTSISLTPIGISSVIIRSYKQHAWMIVLLAFAVGLFN